MGLLVQEGVCSTSITVWLSGILTLWLWIIFSKRNLLSNRPCQMDYLYLHLFCCCCCCFEILFLLIFFCVYAHVHATMQVWKSEDSFLKLPLSFSFMWDLGNQKSGCQPCVFHWVVSPPCTCLLTYGGCKFSDSHVSHSLFHLEWKRICDLLYSLKHNNSNGKASSPGTLGLW